jgi:DNA-binding transcriptional LysR family regulator
MSTEFRHLRHALALGRYRNFARAAEALRLTQPSLTRSIAALEDSLGVRLFDRDKKGIEPTAFGHLLLERGAALLAGEADLRREIQHLAGLDVGALAVGAGPYPVEISVGTAVTRLLRAHPRLKIEVLTGRPDEIARKVLTGQFDVGIAGARLLGDVPRLHVEPVAPHKVYLACRPGHPLAAEHGLTLKRILQFPLATTLLAGAAAAVAGADDSAGRLNAQTGTFTPAVHVDSLALARQIARDSDVLFPGTASMLVDDVRAGRLVRLDFHIPAMRTEYGILTLRSRTLSPAARAFIEHLRNVEAEVARFDAPERLAAERRPARPLGKRASARAA